MVLTSCAAERTQTFETSFVSEQAIQYVSDNHHHIVIFDGLKVFGGPPIELPAIPAKYMTIGDSIQCVSVGPPSSTSEYAIRRPIKLNDRYQCRGTNFYVVRCFNSCKQALVMIDRPANKTGLPTDYFLADDCVGILQFNVLETGKSSPDAEKLQGGGGILASNQYPSCTRSRSRHR
jgi:hypothetical protein